MTVDLITQAEWRVQDAEDEYDAAKAAKLHGERWFQQATEKLKGARAALRQAKR